MSEKSNLTEWPDLAISLYDKLTGRNAEIIYEFENMEISVPAAVNENAKVAPWKLNGILRIRTKDGVTDNK
jgi:hypothetical protein